MDVILIVLMQNDSGASTDNLLIGNKHQIKQSILRHEKLLSFGSFAPLPPSIQMVHVVLWLQVDSLEAVLELRGFLAALLPVLGPAAGERWRTERSSLLLHLLCLCQLCLTAGGDCGPAVGLLQQLLPMCRQVGAVGFSSASLCRCGSNTFPMPSVMVTFARSLARSCRWRSC